MLNVWNSLHSSSLNNQPPACRSETLQASTRASVCRAPPGLTWSGCTQQKLPGGSDQSPGPGAAASGRPKRVSDASSASREQNTEQVKPYKMAAESSSATMLMLLAAAYCLSEAAFRSLQRYANLQFPGKAAFTGTSHISNISDISNIHILRNKR